MLQRLIIWLWWPLHALDYGRSDAFIFLCYVRFICFNVGKWCITYMLYFPLFCFNCMYVCNLLWNYCILKVALIKWPPSLYYRTQRKSLHDKVSVQMHANVNPSLKTNEKHMTAHAHGSGRAYTTDDVSQPQRPHAVRWSPLNRLPWTRYMSTHRTSSQLTQRGVWLIAL